jgi:hypothetical protein
VKIPGDGDLDDLNATRECDRLAGFEEKRRNLRRS